MSRTIHCKLLDEELEGLTFAPYPGDHGQKIYESIPAKGWQKWMAHQTMLINENRLSPINPDHRKFLEGEMVKFLFEGGAEKPAGYVPPDD
jgi:Fe-S cluster biosynthesis and repair protein YggX